METEKTIIIKLTNFEFGSLISAIEDVNERVQDEMKLKVNDKETKVQFKRVHTALTNVLKKLMLAIK